MTACGGCETLPPPLPEGGLLFLAPPLPHTQERLTALLVRSGLFYDEPYGGVFAVDLPPAGLGKLGLELADLLTRVELETCKSLVAPVGTAPTLAELVKMEPLSTLVGRIRGDWLRQMLAEARLVAHFQPIVSAQSTRTVFGYECLVRGRERNGPLIPPDEMFDAAREAGLAPQLDRAARMTSLKAIAASELEGQVFVNLDLASIHDPALCLRTAIRAVAEARIAPERIVFEVKERQAAPDGRFARLLAVLRQNGFDVALDEAGASLSAAAWLGELKPDYVKLGREIIRGVDADPCKAELARRLLETAAGLGIVTIAVGIETEEECQWLQHHGVGYIQGFYVAAPGAGHAPHGAASLTGE